MMLFGVVSCLYIPSNYISFIYSLLANAQADSCHQDPNQVGARVGAFGFVGNPNCVYNVDCQKNAPLMQQALIDNGTLSVAILATDNFKQYK